MGRIAVIVHVYYRELWKELADCIANFPENDTDVFVTIVSDNQCFKAEILSRFPRANIRVVENRGYDVAPFLSVLRAVDLSKYEYVAKLHTKRDDACWVNYLPFVKSAWRKRLLSFCSSRRAVEKTIRFMASHSDVGMVSHPSIIVGRGDFQEREAVKARAEEVVRKLGFATRGRQFVAGTMFICRADCLRPLQGCSVEEFECSAGDASMTGDYHTPGLAHVYERVFGYLTRAEGYRIADVRGLLPLYDATYWIRVPVFYASRLLFRCTLKPLLSLIKR